MAKTTTKTIVFSTVGPAELESRHAYVHEAALDGDEHLRVGMTVELHDEAGRVFVATVTAHDAGRWQFTLAD